MNLIKRIYFPGLISILGIGLWFLVPKVLAPKEVCIELIEPTHCGGCYTASSNAPRVLKTEYFNSKHSKQEREAIIKRGFNTLQAIIETKDTTRNVAFVVKEANYGDMVSIYNQCLIHGINEFTLYRDTLFVLHDRFAVNESHASVTRIEGLKKEEFLLLPTIRRLPPTNPE